MRYCREILKRLVRAWGWTTAQFGGTLILILVGLAWTRIPDKTGFDVALTLILSAVLIAAALALQAGTMRRLLASDEGRVRLVCGALTLLFWLVLGCVAWVLLDWCDNRIPEWAGYLNSRSSAHGRATVFTYAHLQHGLSIAEWVLRWIVVPGKLIPCAVASAQRGWRLPWRNLIGIVFNWRWWPAVVLASLVAVAWPGTFFEALPHGTVSHQIWTVGLKLAAAYVLAVAAWVILLAWAATLLALRDGSVFPPQDDSGGEPVPEPALVGPPLGRKSASVRLPLP
jgi:hypothetical protein